MFIKMRESKGFTLVELMIVVAIIGILAAVAVPFYQKYIQKSRLTSRVFPGIHSIQTNIGSFYSFNSIIPTSPSNTFTQLISDANTACFSVASAGSMLTFTIKNSANSCPELSNLAGLVLTTKASIAHTQIVGWVVGGSLAIQLGLSGLN